MNTIIRAVFGYWFLLLIVRTFSRRPGAQMTPFEFVLVFFIGGIIIASIVGDDRSMTNAVCTVIVIGLMHRLVSWLKQHYPKFGLLLDGTPLVLLEEGQWQSETLYNMRLNDMDVMAAGRAQGLEHLGQIKYAILERNGEISIIKADDEE
jgi:uncharacterized membrane protein YcaP (DUF421 family)